MAIIADRSAEGKFDFVCDERRCGFQSLAWDTEEQASARAAQHAAEHETGEPMIELKDFEATVGYVRNDENAVLAATIEADLKSQEA